MYEGTAEVYQSVPIISKAERMRAAGRRLEEWRHGSQPSTDCAGHASGGSSGGGGNNAGNAEDAVLGMVTEILHDSAHAAQGGRCDAGGADDGASLRVFCRPALTTPVRGCGR
jgi:hypothetical protein